MAASRERCTFAVSHTNNRRFHLHLTLYVAAALAKPIYANRLYSARSFWWLQFARYILFHFECAHAAHYLWSKPPSEWKARRASACAREIEKENAQKCIQRYGVWRCGGPINVWKSPISQRTSRHLSTCQLTRIAGKKCCILLNENIYISMDENESCASSVIAMC